MSAFKFLKNKGDVLLYDDNLTKIQVSGIKKNLTSYKKILKIKFDQIILSPGIDINNCKLSFFLKKIGLRFTLT